MASNRRSRLISEENFRGDTLQSAEESRLMENYQKELEREEENKLISQYDAQSATEDLDDFKRPTHYKTPPKGTVSATERMPMSMIDPSEFDLENVEEPKALPDGTEAKLRIVSVRKAQDKNDLTYFQPMLEVPDEPLSKDFTHFLHLPNKSEMSTKRYNQARFNLKVFMECFEQDPSRGFDPLEDWPGAEGWAILGVKESDEYGQQNYVKKFIKTR